MEQGHSAARPNHPGQLLPEVEGHSIDFGLVNPQVFRVLQPDRSRGGKVAADSVLKPQFETLTALQNRAL